MIYKNGVAIVGDQGTIGVLGPVSTPIGTTQAIDWDNGDMQILDLGSATGDVTLTFENPKDGASYLLKIRQGATDRDVVLPSNVLMQGATAPSTLDITAVDDAVDTLTLAFDGTNYLAQLGQAYG